jgi:hypothetical protein
LLERIAKDPQGSARVSRASLRILRNEWGGRTKRKALPRPSSHGIFIDPQGVLRRF